MNDVAIRLAGVSKTYPHFALRDVSLEVPTGAITGFIGANGAGKSTTMRIVMGLIGHDAGTVSVLGHAIPGHAALAKREIGYVSEEMKLFPQATLAWHCDFVARAFGTWDAEYAASLFRRFDLVPTQKVHGLSHGQRIKAALLLALARRPRLLVLDEPTTGLDPVARHEVLGALTDAMRDEGRSILFSSQNTLDVEQVADRIVFVDRGRIVDADDTQAYLDRWRRVRLELVDGGAAPEIDGAVSLAVTGRTAVLTTDRFSGAAVAACQAAGATVVAVDRMTLEEIFVAAVMARRQEASR